VLRWCCAGAALVLRWCCAGAALVLVLRWCCAGAALVLRCAIVCRLFIVCDREHKYYNYSSYVLAPALSLYHIYRNLAEMPWGYLLPRLAKNS
jgi:hypothetical protein